MNITPKFNADVTNLGVLALAGAEAHGEDVRLRHNTALHIRGDLFALTGNPETPGVPSAQARLAAQLRLMRETYATLQTVLHAARTFCFTGIGLLRPRFGKRWNSDWQAAGFNGGSLAVPAVPLAMLTEFRRFLAGSPDAVAEYGFTAEDAQRHIDAIQAATLARANARGARWSIKRERDVVFQRLRKRLSNLRAELALLIPPTDDRWYAFGFRRPADGQGPEPVRGLNVTLISQEESLEKIHCRKAIRRVPALRRFTRQLRARKEEAMSLPKMESGRASPSESEKARCMCNGIIRRAPGVIA